MVDSSRFSENTDFDLGYALYHAASEFAAQRNAGQNLVTLCAEPGMGKTSFIDSVMLHEAQMGTRILSVSLSDSVSEAPVERLVRLSRETVRLVKSGERVAVAIDNVPVPSVSDVKRESNSIRRMVQSGALVLVAMRPESKALFDALHDARQFGPHALLDLSVGGLGVVSVSDNALRLTHGIPGLLGPYYDDANARNGEYSHGGFPGKFASSMRKLVVSYTRDTLPDEELDLRIAMILLGSGKLSDLVRAVPRFHDETLFLLQESAPLFHIDLRKERYDSAALSNDEVLEYSLSGLMGLLRSRQGIVTACIRILCSEGRYHRADLLSSCIVDDETAFGVFEQYGPELYLSGNTYTVSKALRISKMGEHAKSVVGKLASRMISEANGCYDEAIRRRKDIDEYGSVTERDRSIYNLLLEIEGLRDLLHGEPLDEVNARLKDMEQRTDDPAVHRLARHRGFLVRLFNGDFSEVFSELLGDEDRRDPMDVGQALLCLDFYVAGSMLGGGFSAIELREVETAKRILSNISAGRLAYYVASLDSAIDVIVGSGRAVAGTEQVDTRAALHGDVLVRTAFQVAAAAGDLKSRAFIRSRSRAKNALIEANKFNALYLQDAALLVCVLSGIQLGEEFSLRGLKKYRRESALGELTLVAVKLYRGDSLTDVRLHCLSRYDFPHDHVWALFLLVHYTDVLRSQAREELPISWMRAAKQSPAEEAGGKETVEGQGNAGTNMVPVNSFDRGGRHWHEKTSSDTTPQEDKPSARNQPMVYIRLMGRFSIEVGDSVITGDKLIKRRAIDLIAFLCLAKDHKVTKQEVLLSLWGDDDYGIGMQRIYEATSVFRRAVRSKELGINPIVSSRVEGTIALNPELVTCDVDKFVEEAKGTLIRDGSDREVIDHACSARHWYGGGPAVIPNDPTGTTRRWTKRLAMLYVNALAAGAWAALRQGRSYLAEQLSNEAHTMVPRREDIEKCLVEAYIQLGRISAIEDMHRSYEMRCARGARQRSEELDRLYEEALGGKDSDKGDDEEEKSD